MTINVRTVLYPHLGGGHDTPGMTVKSTSDCPSSEYEHALLLASVAPCKYPAHLPPRISHRSQSCSHSLSPREEISF